ncbi:MAG: hypothetical protein ABI628_05900 [Chloroflexota bacterium]
MSKVAVLVSRSTKGHQVKVDGADDVVPFERPDAVAEREFRNGQAQEVFPQSASG